MRILLIEDDRDLCGVLRPRLEQAGFVVDCCHDGEEGLYYLCQPVYDAAVLDRMLPGLDGVTLLARARAQGIATPVLLLTALDRVQDRVAGLDAGADDYLGKPFDMRELLARLRALCRRPGGGEAAQLRAGDLVLDAGGLILSGPAGQVTLSRREAQLLEALMRAPGQTLHRTVLFGRVWGPDSEVESGNLDSYIHFIRRRLRAVGSRAQAVTVRGVGYRLEVGGC